MIQEALPQVFDSMVREGDLSGAVKLYQEILQLLEGNQGDESVVTGQGTSNVQEAVVVMEEGRLMAAGEDSAPQAAGKMPEAAANSIDRESGEMLSAGGEKAIPSAEARTEESMAALTKTTGSAESAAEGLRGAVAGQVIDILNHTQLSGEASAAIREQMMQFAQGQRDLQQLFTTLNTLAEGAKFSTASAQALEKLFSGKAFRSLIAGQLKNSWTLRPEDLTTPGKVEELYRRMDRQLKGLSEVLENSGQTNSTAFKAVASLSQNVDFLQQVNQMYAYVQLPLRLQQGDAHGELYVYTNKKKLTDNDGTVSALLHLDMEHLGPVDVHVAMKDSKVNTRFYLRDEEMIDFLAAHMDILTKRLQKRGYDCSFSMTVRKNGAQEEKGGLEPILRQEKGIVLSQYAFDVRT